MGDISQRCGVKLDASGFLEKGKYLAKQKKYDSAIKAFTNSIRASKPEDKKKVLPFVYYNLGKAIFFESYLKFQRASSKTDPALRKNFAKAREAYDEVFALVDKKDIKVVGRMTEGIVDKLSQLQDLGVKRGQLVQEIGCVHYLTSFLESVEYEGLPRIKAKLNDFT